jgi:hypothetical protein
MMVSIQKSRKKNGIRGETYRVVIAFGLVNLGNFDEAGMGALKGVDPAFKVLVFLGKLGDIVLVDGAETFAGLLVQIAERLANFLELRRHISGEVLPLIHIWADSL